MNNKQVLNKIDGYLKVPVEIFKIKDDHAALLFLYLLNQAEWFHPSLKKMADDNGWSVNTVRKALEYLLKSNVIRKTSNYIIGKYSTQYEFVPLEEWAL